MREPPRRRGGRMWRGLTWPLRLLVEPQPPAVVTLLVMIAMVGAFAWLTRDQPQPAPTAANAANTAPALPDPDALALPKPNPVVLPLWPTPTPAPKPGGAFEGTLAGAFPIGVAGLVVPSPPAVPGFTSAQVADALELVRQALIAGRLDRQMLVGHDPAALLALLAPSQRAGATEAFAAGSFAGFATWIDGSATLADDPPRVSGTMMVRAGATPTSTAPGAHTPGSGPAGSGTAGSRAPDSSGYLVVTTNHVWIYPFISASYGSRLVVVHSQVEWQVHLGPDTAVADRGLWIVDTTLDLQGVSCGAAAAGLILPKRPDEPVTAEGRCASPQ